MEKSFARLAGFEHESEMLDGYVDLIECVDQEKELTPSAIYTNAVLNLHVQDEDGVVDGQEGFLDSIKRGATKVYEWIKSIIRAIRNWFSGSNNKEYAAAKVSIKGLDSVEALDKELDKKLMDIINSNNKLADIDIKQAIGETKKIIQENITNQAQELKTDVEKKEKIIGTIVNEISNKILVRFKQTVSRIEEIKRIDPTGETLELLGLSRNWKFISDANLFTETNLNKENQVNFARTIKTIVDNAEDIQRDLSKAVTALDKINEASRNDESESRRVARAGSVVKELSELAAIYRDMVITISSQVQMGYKKAEASIVKHALLDAMKHSDEIANKYIQQAIDSL